LDHLHRGQHLLDVLRHCDHRDRRELDVLREIFQVMGAQYSDD
jgi:hypothetical protein